MAYPDADNLTTIDKLKAWLRIQDNNSNEHLTSLLTRGSNLCLMYSGREFAADRTLTFNGEGGDKLFIAPFPINSVTSLTIDDVDIPAKTSTSYGYWFSSRVLYLDGYEFTRGIANVVVVLNCGIAANSKEAKILEQATLEYCNWVWAKRTHPDTQVQSTGDSVWSKWDMSELPPSIKGTLNTIARVR